MEDIREMLKKVAAGELSVDNAVLELKKEPFTAAGYDDLGFAKLDTHRKLRQGAAEVIYGAGKTPEQIAGQPSTTTPMAFPWDSPQVVTLNIVPMVEPAAMLF